MPPVHDMLSLTGCTWDNNLSAFVISMSGKVAAVNPGPNEVAVAWKKLTLSSVGMNLSQPPLPAPHQVISLVNDPPVGGWVPVAPETVLWDRQFQTFTGQVIISLEAELTGPWANPKPITPKEFVVVVI